MLAAEITPILEFTEFETKYRVEASTLFEFKNIVEKLPNLKKFVYVQGSDLYFTKGDSFIRYRKADHGLDERSELTVKTKTQENNNVIRREVNLRVDKNDYETVEAFIGDMGFDFEFKIWKMCHIYNYEDVTLVCYTVQDDAEKLHHFIEIEVNEDLEFTKPQAWDIIRKYETLLEPLGINSQRRLRKSLFEMFRKRQ